MSRVRVHNFTISLDGYGAGPFQTREDPLGVGGETLHEWFIPTRAFQRINGKSGGATGVDDDIAARDERGLDRRRLLFLYARGCRGKEQNCSEV